MTGGGRDGTPWDAEDLVPARQVPPLPWSPPLESDDTPSHRWLLTFGFGVFLAIAGNLFGEPWYPLGALIVVAAVYQDLPAACDRLTVTTNGLEVRGVLLRRTYTWPAIRKLSARRYQVTADLDRFGTKHWRFDKPIAAEVAGILERLRRTAPTAPPRRTITLSWGALVLLSSTTITVLCTWLSVHTA